MRRLEINGGVVAGGPPWRLDLPATKQGYADAQIDDYGLAPGGRRGFLWPPGVRLRLEARFSHPAGALLGTAGFGFWNAPFGDPTVRWPALPRAAWFFYASEPTDLPLAPAGPGRGWFAATLDAARPAALAWAPLTPLVLLLNRVTAVRRRLWPRVQHSLGISYAPLSAELTAWHNYELQWQPDGCRFLIDDALVLHTPHSPGGPLGFVCWLDNQYMVATATGQVRWGIIPTPFRQWMEVSNLHVAALETES